MKAGDLLTELAQASPATRTQVIRDADIEVTCPECGNTLRLDQARVRQESGSFVYRCPQGCPNPLVTVRSHGGGKFALEVHIPSGLHVRG
jgi:predicted RNA-binding Zn-ribbon protein involved in translation (DUF1610 family)